MNHHLEMNEDLTNVVRDRIERLRPKLLDLTRRNPLINTRFSPRSASIIRVVDELPDNLAETLSFQKQLRFVSLPPLDDDPSDEQSSEFQDELSSARLADEEYIAALGSLDPNSDDAIDIERQIERALRDRVRVELGMAPRQANSSASLQLHAINNGISPHYDLPPPGAQDANQRYADENIQTLLLPSDMERKLNALSTKCRTWEQETGINVLHAAFGFLQWEDPRSRQENNAPLILLPVKLERVRSRRGAEFWISSDGDDFEKNIVLSTYLSQDFGIDLPEWEGGSIERYLGSVEETASLSLKWRVRRQIAFGVFPSSRMAMYSDLDPQRNDISKAPLAARLLATGATGDASAFADEYDVDVPAIESKVPYLVRDADSSQFSAIVDIMEGVDLAVEGPPGTGKSQTIVNAIANAVIQGKKVLFVAEKTAALEVVQARLDAVGLGEFLLPLQATRSTRQEVIDSIRSRLALRRPATPKNFSSTVDEFKGVRSELQAYIDIVASPFGETGLTVYEVFGKGMRTSHLLEGMSSMLSNPRVEGIETLTRQQTKLLSEAADIFARAWAEAQKAPQHWSGLGVRQLNRFIVSDLVRQALATSKSIEEVCEVRQYLPTVSLEADLNLDRLRQIKIALDTIDPLSASLDRSLLLGLIEPTKRQRLVDFLASCRKYRALVAELERVVETPESPDAPIHARELLRLCEAYGIGFLDPTLTAKKKHAYTQAIASMISIRDQATSFVAAFPETAGLSLQLLAKAGAVVRETDREVIFNRSTSTASHLALPLIRDLIRTGRRLRDERNLLVSNQVAESLTVYELRAHAETLHNAGVLGRMSPSYKAARRTFEAIAGPVEFSREFAASTLQRLAIWKDEVRQYTEDLHARSTLGLLFRGIDTDFDLLSKLCEFYERIDTEFQSSAQHELHVLLKSGEPRLLFALPQFTDDAPDKSLGSLEKDIALHEKALTTQDSIVKEVARHVSILRDQTSASLVDLEEIASRLEQLALLGTNLDSDHEMSDLLGPKFAGRNTGAAIAEDEIAVVDALQMAGEDSPLLLRLVEQARTHDALRIVSDVVVRANEAEVAVANLEKLSGKSFSQDLLGMSQPEIVTYLQEAASYESSLYTHAALASAREDIDRSGFGWIISALEDEQRPLDNLQGVFDAVLTRAMAVRAYEEYGNILYRYPGATLTDLRSRLAQLDREIIALSCQFIRASLPLQANPPQGTGIGSRAEWTEMALINNEVAKKKRHVSVRSLTHRAGNALLELKPCWMMSPLAVAQYLPHDLQFDLCIIDEASQMPPEDALGALGRSKQAVIVGDTNQLPPSTFFRKLLEEEEEEDAVLEESILELANGVFRPARRLRWHYRSQDPSLIQFSNEHIYGNDLIVFPSPELDRDDMGVKFVAVEGRYRNGVNSPEAIEMVRWARQFVRKFPNRSLGLVTLNQKQRDLLIEEWERVLGFDTHAANYVQDWATRNDGLESFFIKNLENVQGDERDVIMVGTVYGPESPGQPVLQRFGPVNGVAGKRRLNVLFTRAKQMLVTFSSMKAEDIRADENGNPGAFMLKRWLEYAATGMLHGGNPHTAEPDSDFELFVMDQLRAIGCEPVPQVGVRGYRIDIGVRHPLWPHGFLMGVECDGATYHSSRSARDRDRLREEVLKSLGWHLHRIWSTDWFNDPRGETERLRNAIDARLRHLRDQQSTNEFELFEDLPDSQLNEENDAIGVATDRSGSDRPDAIQMGILHQSDVPSPQLGWTDSGIPSTRHSQSADNKPAPMNEAFESHDSLMRNEITRFDTVSNGTPKFADLNPDRFYDASYVPTLRRIAAAIVDSEGPITFLLLSEMVARAHGWQRTGSRIKQQVWAAVASARRQSRGPDKKTVLWPNSSDPQQFVPFRGMTVNGHKRDWRDISYPEKLGLAISVVRSPNVRDHIAAMASQIGLERIRKSAREELESLVDAAKTIESSVDPHRGP